MRVRAAIGAGLAGAMLWAPGAEADQTIYAGPPSQYFNGRISMAQGERVTLTNLDTIQHDVVARDKGPDGEALFRSELVGPSGSAPVTGANSLTTGTYEFVCSIHPGMVGQLQVSAAGTPAPRPGSGGGGQPQQRPPGGGDSRAPRVGVRLLDTRIAAVRRRRALRLDVSADEPVTVGLTVRSGRTTLGSTTIRLSRAGRARVSVRLTRAGRRLVGRARRLRLAVSARAADAASNTVTARSSGTIRR